MKKLLALFALAILQPLIPVHAQTHIREEVGGYQIGRTPQEHFSLWGVWPPVAQQSGSNELLSSLEAIGVIGTSGTSTPFATPLNLDGGKLTAGAIALSGTLTAPTLSATSASVGTLAVTGSFTLGGIPYLTGTISPIAGAVAAPPCTHYLVNTGTSAADYVKLSGTGSSGWGVVITGTGP